MNCRGGAFFLVTVGAVAGKRAQPASLDEHGALSFSQGDWHVVGELGEFALAAVCAPQKAEAWS
jgi:hypothetical protein